MLKKETAQASGCQESREEKFLQKLRKAPPRRRYVHVKATLISKFLTFSLNYYIFICYFYRYIISNFERDYKGKEQKNQIIFKKNAPVKKFAQKITNILRIFLTY